MTGNGVRLSDTLPSSAEWADRVRPAAKSLPGATTPLHQQRQTVNRLPKVGGAASEIDPIGPDLAQHAYESARTTAASSSGSKPGLTSMPTFPTLMSSPALRCRPSPDWLPTSTGNHLVSFVSASSVLIRRSQYRNRFGFTPLAEHHSLTPSPLAPYWAIRFSHCRRRLLLTCDHNRTSPESTFGEIILQAQTTSQVCAV